MSYEYKGSSTPTEQSSLAGAVITEEEKLRKAKKDEMKKKYRNMSMILVWHYCCGSCDAPGSVEFWPTGTAGMV